MSFSSSCHAIVLTRSAQLSARCLNEHGQYVSSTLDLDYYLTNRNGEFCCKTGFGAGFVTSAQNIVLRDGAVLCASLLNDHGSLVPAIFNLNFCVANINGQLVFKKP
jgi:hypothetical protein